MDRMRVVGPSTSVPPQLGEGGAEAAAASGTTASRQDGRADDELRKICKQQQTVISSFTFPFFFISLFHQAWNVLI